MDKEIPLTIDLNGVETSVLELELRFRRTEVFGTSIGFYHIALVRPEPIKTPGIAWDMVNNNIFNVIEVEKDMCRTSCYSFPTMYMRPVVIDDNVVPRRIRRGVIMGDFLIGDRFVVAVGSNGRPLIPLVLWLRSRDESKGVLEISSS